MTPAKNFTGIRLKGAGGSAACRTASTWGIPLPEACGEKRRTNQAAAATATAHPTVTNRKPTSRWPCAQTINRSRKRSACSSERRKAAPMSPDPAPTSSAKSASATRRARLWALSSATSGSRSIDPHDLEGS